MVLLQGCGSEVLLPRLLPGESPTAPPEMVFHADIDFTSSERLDLERAAYIWNKQTSGLAKITFVYDLELTSVSNIVDHQLEHQLMRATNDLDIVAEEDEDCAPDDPSTLWNEHHCVLAWMTSGGIHNPWHHPVRGVFNVDRMEGVSVQVMLHEFGHALGLAHLEQVQAIMYPNVSRDRTVCLKKPDLVAFCGVNECGTHKMLPCE